MKKLPIGKQNFKEIIEDGFVYVDKTKQIYELLDAGNLYFLSRPRRFGKSLLISTLYYLYSGEKELFKGLYIHDKTDWKWEKYPILEFNFANYGHKVDNLEACIKDELSDFAEEFDITIPTDRGISRQFMILVRKIVKTHGKVVILIDEYDKPIIDFITTPQKANQNRAIIKDLFAPLKTFEAKGYLKLLFITGVSKFTKVSIFSDLNNLTELTLHRTAKDIVGITHQELDNYFKEPIHKIALKYNTSAKQLLKEMKFWYDGYSWDGKTFLYNPFSLLSFLDFQRFDQYWFATGTPTFLVDVIRQGKIHINQLKETTVNTHFFTSFDIKDIELNAYHLLFQTGYVTVKAIKIEKFEETFTLGYPNQEVQNAFLYSLLEAYTFKPSEQLNSALLKIRTALRKNDLPTFIKQLKILFSDISYQLLPKKKHKNATEQSEQDNFAAWEGYFQTVIYLILSFLNISIHTEVSKHKGRMDGIAETDDFLYIMEYKLEGTTDEAFAQIKKGEYMASYGNKEKTIILVAIIFGREERNVTEWKAETWKTK